MSKHELLESMKRRYHIGVDQSVFVISGTYMCSVATGSDNRYIPYPVASVKEDGAKGARVYALFAWTGKAYEMWGYVPHCKLRDEYNKAEHLVTLRVFQQWCVLRFPRKELIEDDEKRRIEKDNIKKRAEAEWMPRAEEWQKRWEAYMQALEAWYAQQREDSWRVCQIDRKFPAEYWQLVRERIADRLRGKNTRWLDREIKEIDDEYARLIDAAGLAKYMYDDAARSYGKCLADWCRHPCEYAALGSLESAHVPSCGHAPDSPAIHPPDNPIPKPEPVRVGWTGSSSVS